MRAHVKRVYTSVDSGESRDHHENSRPTRWIRSGWDARGEKKTEREKTGKRYKEDARESRRRRGQGRPGSKGLGREEGVGGIPLAPRDDNHLVSRRLLGSG